MNRAQHSLIDQRYPLLFKFSIDTDSTSCVLYNKKCFQIFTRNLVKETLKCMLMFERRSKPLRSYLCVCDRKFSGSCTN